ncbi:SseB family protein [Cellulomonas endophytica]|uniref:SseB family protein n=1 Tax=Cellulomonas endophytica TaxID=2494735 RepID=UPI001011ED9F|nr:SseB family protein [Cellulomonas endophytica]
MTAGGRALPPTSPFAGDDGRADPRLAAALARHAGAAGPAGPAAGLAEVVAALAAARVLVPVLAVLEEAGEVEHDGHAHAVDKEASAGVVALRTADGRTAMPVFSSVAAMTAWRADARPVPTAGPRAALSAAGEGWEVLVVDPAGPATAVVPRPAVWALAQGLPWAPAVLDGEVDAEVAGAVRRALADVPGVVAAGTSPGTRAEVAVTAVLVPGLDRARLDAVLARVNAALAADEVVAARVDSLELRVRPATQA